MKVLEQDMRSGQFKPVYLIWGEEAFLKRSYKNRMKAAIIGEDTVNFHCFEGKGPDLEEIISLADTVPFFAEKRLILVEDSGLFKGSGADPLAEYIPRMPQTSCLLFVESQVDRRSRLYKLVKEKGHAAEMARQDSRKLADWAGRILAREGKRITGRTMELLLGKTGDDMENIRMELEKLICYLGADDTVTDEDVEAICTDRVTNRIFEMVEAIAAGRPGTALDRYKDLLALREPPMRILFLIARQFNRLLQVREMADEGRSRGDIASELKLQPFIAGKLMNQASVFGREQILAYVELCVELEEAVKTGRLEDQLAVELLITKNLSRG